MIPALQCAARGVHHPASSNMPPCGITPVTAKYDIPPILASNIHDERGLIIAGSGRNGNRTRAENLSGGTAERTVLDSARYVVVQGEGH